MQVSTQSPSIFIQGEYPVTHELYTVRVLLRGIVIQCLQEHRARKTGDKKGTVLVQYDASEKKDPAATYSPGASPLKYHRRMKA